VESFLPLYETINRWKDRKVRVQLPLFPGYLFVHLDLADRLNVLQVAGVARFVNFGGTAIPVPTPDIESLRAGLIGGLRVEPHPYLKLGRRARVKYGPLQGMEGILLKKKNKERFVISLDLIMRSVAVEIDVLDLEAVGTRVTNGG
jgi:transcription antitermination factor NusG